MRFAVSMFPTSYSMRPDEIAREVEDRGFDALFFPDHSHIPLVRRNATSAGDGELATFYADGMDPFVALTAAALATERLKLGTGVCLVMQRDAIQTAKEVASLDVLSNGRVLFGVGAGWDAEEMEHHGTPYSRRFTVLRERIEAMRVLWTQDVCEYHGEFVNFGPSHQRPKPVQQPHPPVYLGNNHHNALRRVVRYADGWIPNYARVEDVPSMIAELQELAAQAGRGPIPVTVVNVPPEPEVIETLEAAGVERCSLWMPPASGREVLPLLDDRARLVERYATA